MRTFKGTVSQVRAVAVTTVQSNLSSTKHQTSLRFGDFSLNLTTKAPPAIHIGDELRVYGAQVGGQVWPFLLRNQQNGYEAGFANLLAVVLSIVVAGGLLAYAVVLKNVPLMTVGAISLATSVVFGMLRRFAVSAVRSSQA